jgi:hypothetical protein
MRTDDYTRLSIGTKIDNGEIQPCSHCDKLGLLEEVYGKKFFTHYQSVGFSDKGLPEIRWDWCPKQEFSMKPAIHGKPDLRDAHHASGTP